MSEKWLIADLHLGHQRLVDGWGEEVGARKGPRSQFVDADAMSEHIFERWASVVAPQDRVYVLGDVAFKRPWLLAMRDLPGHKRIIGGNHDKQDADDYIKVFEKIYGVTQLEPSFVLTHIPIHPGQLSARASMRVNIHGHLHEDVVSRDCYSPVFSEVDPRYVCVSCEQIDFTPINLDVIIERTKELLA